MRIFKRAVALLAVAVMICALSITAFAHEIPDATRKGSITVTLKDGSTAVSGGTLTLYKVGDVTEDDGNYSFELSEEYKGSGLTFEKITTEQAVKDLADYAKSRSANKKTEKVNNSGTAVFSDLEIGLYLIAQYEPAEGYLEVNPFLVTVPMTEGESYIYDVNASPKVLPPEKAPTTQEETTVKAEESTKVEETTGIEPESTTEKPEETTKPSLPVTGQLNWPIPVLTVFGLFLILVGCTLKFGKKGIQQS